MINTFSRDQSDEFKKKFKKKIQKKNSKKNLKKNIFLHIKSQQYNIDVHQTPKKSFIHYFRRLGASVGWF